MQISRTKKWVLGSGIAVVLLLAGVIVVYFAL